MANKQITAIMMATPPAKTEYVVGFEGLDLTGGLLNLVYSDGSFEQIPLGPNMEYFVDNGKVGFTNVTVRYSGLQTGFRIRVREPKLSKVTIISPPDKTSYTEGERLDLTGLRLMGRYDGGQDKEITPIPKLDHIVQMGEAVVPLPIDNLLIPILIQVNPSKPVNIKMHVLPSKLVYMEQLEPLDVTGGMVEKSLSNGRIELVPLTLDMVTGFDNTKVGKQSLKVTYGGQTCAYDIEIIARRCEQLELKCLPVKRVYIEGEPFDLTGIELTASKDSFSWSVPIQELSLQQTIAKTGALNMVVCYQDQSVEFPVTVNKKRLQSISLQNPPITTVYKEPDVGETIAIDPAGGTLTLQYDNGETEQISLTMAFIEPIQSGQVGPQSIVVHYGDLQTTLSINVEPKKLLGIYISKPPAKTQYRAGESFDNAGMEVSAFYDNGQTILVDRYTYSIKPLALGDTTVVITYIDKTAIVPITVSSSKPITMRRRNRSLPRAERFYPGTLELRFNA